MIVLAALLLNVVAYVIARRAHARSALLLASPALLAPLLVAVALAATRIDREAFVIASRPLTWMLGPATVALAVPIYRERDRVRRLLPVVVSAVLVGVVTSIVIAVGLGLLLHLGRTLVASLVARSVTTPIALPLTERLHGAPRITLAAVLLSGLIGASIGPRILDRFGVRDRAARGLALGTSAHGFGTARAIEEGPIEGAMSGVAMGLSGAITTAIVVVLVLVADGATSP